jgi:hypothetical protein
MKFLKALIVFLVVLVLGAVLASVVGWFLLRGTPDWYKADAITAEQRQAAANKAEDMLTRMTNWAGAAQARRASQVADGPTTTQASGVLGHEPSQPFEIQFTDVELNAFFNKWADLDDRRAVMDRYVENPRLALRDHQLILAGNVKDLGMVVSLQFEPKIDERGKLRMDLVRVMGGLLPLPDAMWADKREKFEKMLRSELPKYQRSAKFSSEGTANGAAASAAMDKLLLATLNREPAAPVVFVPYQVSRLNSSVPAKITAVSIQDHTLTMTVEQMTTDERDALLTWLREPYDMATVMAR